MSRADLRFDRGSNPPLRMGSPNKADGIGGQADQQWGRCRGGFGTKIHAAVNGLGLPVELTLTPGQATDVTQAKPLIERSDIRDRDRGQNIRLLKKNRTSKQSWPQWKTKAARPRCPAAGSPHLKLVA